MNPESENPTGCCPSSPATNERRKFLKTAAGGALLASFGDLALNPKMVFAKDDQQFDNLIPADKGLSAEWFLDLSRRESMEVYHGWQEQLQYIGMPVGGIGCGQLYLGGDGRLWLWDIFKSNYQREPDHGQRLNAMSAGGHYAQPVAQGELYNKWNGASVAQGFALKVQQSGKVDVRTLDHSGFPEVSFRGEYPLGKVHYADDNFPVQVDMEAFSPFIPGNAQDSALPLTVLSFQVTNTSSAPVEMKLLGWLENATCPYSHNAKFGSRNNRINHSADSTSIYSSIELSDAGRKRSDIQGIGSMALTLLQSSDDIAVLAVPDLDTESTLSNWFEQTDSSETVAEKPLSETLVGAMSAAVTLQPGESRKLEFLISWYFPEHADFKSFSSYRFYGPKEFATAKRHYATRFSSALDVADHASKNQERLFGVTRLWNETWYDSSLPHWFLDRTFIAINCIATQMFHWFDNGRPYAWEGVDCCPGTCTHVWHYAQGLSRIFPELERLFRQRVDFDVGFNKRTGEISARGEIPVEKSAVDGHAGTILRVYREHQMSADSVFLETLWPRVKLAVEFLMAQDPDASGLLRGRQYNTLDAAWYGPMGWISSLYLAALSAAEAMALEMGDSDLANTCNIRVERGRENIVGELFNGEYFIHKPDPNHPNAIRTGNGCHIDQVLGQAWTHQVNLQRVIPKEESISALNSLWAYNFAPDAGQYALDNIAIEPAFRPYAMPGEAGLVMCAWPQGGAEDAIPDRKLFGLIADETNYRSAENPEIWTGPGGYFNECMNGFEYQVAWHMISEGEADDELVQRGLAVTRAVHERYGAHKRNPYNEIECSDHYARSMASYGVFLAACGFDYHGPKGHIGFAPKISPNNFKAAFTAADGWGSYSQVISGNKMEAVISLAHGSLNLNTIDLQLPEGFPQTSSVMCNNTPSAFTQAGSKISISMTETLVLGPGETLRISL